MSKSLFASKTFWGIVFTLAIAVLPKIAEAIEKEKVSAQDVVAIMLAIATSGLAITGRVEAEEPVHTPQWLPGPNKEDFEEEKTD